jgi:hypothetical protein
VKKNKKSGRDGAKTGKTASASLTSVQENGKILFYIWRFEAPGTPESRAAPRGLFFPNSTESDSLHIHSRRPL